MWPHLALSPLNHVHAAWAAVLGHDDGPLGHSLLAQAEQAPRQQVVRVALEQISPFRRSKVWTTCGEAYRRQHSLAMQAAWAGALEAGTQGGKLPSCRCCCALSAQQGNTLQEGHLLLLLLLHARPEGLLQPHLQVGRRNQAC